MQHCKPKVFFIGFNKTATVAFHQFFLKNNYSSWHNYRRKGKKHNIGKRMDYNLINHKPILTGIDDAIAYSDLGGANKNSIVEGCFFYKELYKEYPSSYYILQTRTKENWINSRIKWNNLPQRTADILNISTDQVIKKWREDWDIHHKNVRKFFEDKDIFLEYNIETDNIMKLINFLSKDFNLNPIFWKKRNVSK